ncbi:MAG: S-adenosylmethionine decarboxylase proenzyme (EC, prokaryotic class 1B [uncultured Thiotrichaceae bacterium]|uniref:S-adenosylmethionine decarboxylase proenzyme n=1 Tax=uncultured Thiotrichaceae bacterium TaxID=298394 RepID=A0A6S6TAN3_9GAMM|nr:MAG: S-adenosylmethionine decarboxylase proenzyme (EC, prokaryotic class 1B [uncultured Thiotrichaceae bacterium]
MSNTNTLILNPKIPAFTAAGHHLLIDLWTKQNLDNIDYIEKTLRKCVTACHATLLHIHVHHFSPHMGVSGVAVLAESHISVHTWPEQGYAAFDVFMCGNTQPQNAVKILKQAFTPTHCKIQEIQRSATIKN